MKQPRRATEPERRQEFLPTARLGPVSFSLVFYRVLEAPLELDRGRTDATFRPTGRILTTTPSPDLGSTHRVDLESTVGLDAEVCVL